MYAKNRLSFVCATAWIEPRSALKRIEISTILLASNTWFIVYKRINKKILGNTSKKSNTVNDAL